MPDSAFMTVQQAADEFQVSATTIRSLIKQNRLRAVKLGRSVRIPTAELHRLTAEALDGCENGAASE